MKDLFSEFDNDGSGQIDLDEFRYTIMTTMALNVTQAAVDALFVAWDVDGSGEIDVSEADSKKLEPLCSPPPQPGSSVVAPSQFPALISISPVDSPVPLTCPSYLSLLPVPLACRLHRQLRSLTSCARACRW